MRRASGDTGRAVSYLPRYDDGNGWNNILPPPKPARVASGVEHADWLVIGAGYAGLSAARRLGELHPQQRIALVEATRIGRATAGRNAGMAIDHPFLQEAKGDLARAARILRLHQAGIAMLDRQVRENRIDCQWSKRGKYQVACGDAASRLLDQMADLLTGLGLPFDRVGGNVLQERLGIAGYRTAIHTAGTHLTNPAALTRGLAATLPANVALYEDSPVTRLATGPNIVAETAGGTIRAARAVLATDGFAPAFGVLQGRMVNIVSFAILTEPMTSAQQVRLGGGRDWGVHPAGRGGATIRRTQDERIWYRTTFRHAQQMHCSPTATAHHHRLVTESFRRRFPQLDDLRIAHRHYGGLSFSHNDEPLFAHVEPNLFAVVCQNGVGIAKGTIHGALMAEWASGGTSPLIDDVLAYGTPSKLPPAPIMKLGVTARLALARFAGRME